MTKRAAKLNIFRRFFGAFAALAFSCSIGLSQNLEWSNPRKLKGSAIYSRVIGQNQDGLYVLRFRNYKSLTHNILIERYFENLGFNVSKNISLKKSKLLFIELQDTGFIIFTTYYNRVDAKNEVRYQWYDKNINPIDKPRIATTAAISDYYDKGDFRIKFSPNRERILISHTEKSEQNGRILCFSIFDKKMRLLAYKKYELTKSFDNFFMPDMLVDNSGNAFFMVSQHEIDNKKENTPANAWVYQFNIKNKRLIDYQILDSSKNLQKTIFTFDVTKNKINLTALYTGKNPFVIEGLFNFELPIDTAIKPKSTYKEFTPDFKRQLFGEERLTVFPDIKNFDLLEVIPNTDGGITILAERSSVSNEEDVTYINGMPSTTARNIYNFDDVLVFSIDSASNIRWKYLIRKSQSSLNDNGYYSSIVVANTRSNLYVLYNDRLRTNGDVMQYEFTPEGEVTYKILVRSDNNFVSIIPSEALQIGYNKLILPVTKDRKFSLLKLEYPH
ncbi:MAG: hypothetical protein H6607_01875 [Flavobacteriales bacterium]|nr:hypothetical protein [Flavobacteriales bacterium]